MVFPETVTERHSYASTYVDWSSATLEWDNTETVTVLLRRPETVLLIEWNNANIVPVVEQLWQSAANSKHDWFTTSFLQRSPNMIAL